LKCERNSVVKGGLVLCCC